MKVRIEYAALAILVVLIAAFFAVRYVLPNIQERAYDVDGLNVYSKGQPKAAMKAVLAPDKILVELDLVNQNSSKNTAVQVMSAEIASAMAREGKNVSSYGIVDGKPAIDCTPETNQCTGAQVRVRVGDCNCIRVSASILVEGDENFLKANAVKMRGILSLILQEARTGQ